VRFVVAGTGTAEAELKKQARSLGLMGNGTFLGWVGDDMLHSLYRIADVCIVPSIYEPFGLVALEAMASGCLTIVADTGGLREVVPGDGSVGMRFRSRDADSLGAILEDVLSDDETREQVVAAAREHVLSFDWAEVGVKTRELYEAAVGLPAPRAGDAQLGRPGR
jgi:glycogen(starch) synthase